MMANDTKHGSDGLGQNGKATHHMLARALAIGAVTAVALFGTATHAADDQGAAPKMDQGATTKTFVKDSVITTKVKAKLASEHISTLAKIKVDTDNKGAVVLSGNVKSQEEADKAALIAQNTEGVTSVQNLLQVKKDEPGKY